MCAVVGMCVHVWVRINIFTGSILVPRLKLLLQLCLLQLCSYHHNGRGWFVVTSFDLPWRHPRPGLKAINNIAHIHTRNTRHVQCVSLKSLLCLCYNILIIWCNYSYVCVEVSSNKGVEKDITWLLLWRLLCFLRQSLLLAFPFLGFQCRLERPKSSPPSSNTVLCFLQIYF